MKTKVASSFKGNMASNPSQVAGEPQLAAKVCLKKFCVDFLLTYKVSLTLAIGVFSSSVLVFSSLVKPCLHKR